MPVMVAMTIAIVQSSRLQWTIRRSRLLDMFIR
jgi:hypothetical protein